MGSRAILESSCSRSVPHQRPEYRRTLLGHHSAMLNDTLTEMHNVPALSPLYDTTWSLPGPSTMYRDQVPDPSESQDAGRANLTRANLSQHNAISMSSVDPSPPHQGLMEPRAPTPPGPMFTSAHTASDNLVWQSIIAENRGEGDGFPHPTVMPPHLSWTDPALPILTSDAEFAQKHCEPTWTHTVRCLPA